VLNRCLRCDYPLDQLPSDTCPECGLTATDEGLEVWLAPERRRTNFILLLSIAWFAFYFGGNEFLVGTVDRIDNRIAVILQFPFLFPLIPALLFCVTCSLNKSTEFEKQKSAITVRKWLFGWLAAHTLISALTLLI